MHGKIQQKIFGNCGKFFNHTSVCYCFKLPFGDLDSRSIDIRLARLTTEPYGFDTSRPATAKGITHQIAFARKELDQKGWNLWNEIARKPVQRMNSAAWGGSTWEVPIYSIEVVYDLMIR